MTASRCSFFPFQTFETSKITLTPVKKLESSLPLGDRRSAGLCSTTSTTLPEKTVLALSKLCSGVVWTHLQALAEFALKIRKLVAIRSIFFIAYTSE
jgi:hypothetical protein